MGCLERAATLLALLLASWPTHHMSLELLSSAATVSPMRRLVLTVVWSSSELRCVQCSGMTGRAGKGGRGWVGGIVTLGTWQRCVSEVAAQACCRKAQGRATHG